MPSGLANLLREVHPRLDGTLLVRRLVEISTLRVDTLDLERAAAEIITGSARAVGDPVAYVARSIQREPWRWVKAELLDAAPSAGGEPKWAAGRTAAQEAADVRSARARGIVPTEWPEHRPLTDSARHSLERARRADMDRQHLDSRGKEIHV